MLQWRNLAETSLIRRSKRTSSGMCAEIYCTCVGVIRKAFLLFVLFPKIHILSLIMQKHQTNSNWGTFYRILEQKPHVREDQ